jgi:hypothetical protein
VEGGRRWKGQKMEAVFEIDREIFEIGHDLMCMLY